MATPTTNWKNGELQIASTLWLAGKSYTEIAYELGPTYTRNAVAAKAYDHKNMFPSRDPSKQPKLRGPKIDREELAKLWNGTSLSSREIADKLGSSQATILDIVRKNPESFKKRKHGAPSTGKQKLTQQPFLPPVEKYRVVKLDEFEISRLPGVSLIDNIGCRWPISEGPFMFCGCACEDGKAYCAHHVRKNRRT